jgi:multidrug efflux pump subunit AcrB
MGLGRQEDSHREMRVNTRFNGQVCVKLNVLEQARANTVAVSDGVQARLAELEGEIPEDVRFGVVENHRGMAGGRARAWGRSGRPSCCRWW